MLPQDTTHLIQRPCYQRVSPCQDPASNWTTRRPPDHRKDAQTAVVWSCLPFIRSGQNHRARYSERGKKTRQTEEEVGRQHQGVDRPGVAKIQRVSYLVSWCFKPSQPQRITSGLHTNFTLSPSYSLHKSLYHKPYLLLLFLAYLYSAGTQHGNPHPAVWPILFCGPTQGPCVSYSQHRNNRERFWKKCR